MKRTLKRISPLKAAKIAALLYACIGLVIIPLFVLSFMFDPEINGFVAVIVSLIVPIFYMIIGFLGTLITCALYNFIAKHIGGIEVEVAGAEPQEHTPLSYS